MNNSALPKAHSMWTEEGKALGSLCKPSVVSDGQGKSLTTFSTPTLHKQPDGTCIERGVDGRGAWLYRHWDSYRAAIEYRPEHPKHVQNEQW